MATNNNTSKHNNNTRMFRLPIGSSPLALSKIDLARLKQSAESIGISESRLIAVLLKKILRQPLKFFVALLKLEV